MGDEINEAIATHGPLAVYDATDRRMSGDRGALAELGIGDGTESLGLAYDALSRAHDAMTDSQREAQHAIVTAQLDSRS